MLLEQALPPATLGLVSALSWALGALEADQTDAAVARRALDAFMDDYRPWSASCVCGWKSASTQTRAGAEEFGAEHQKTKHPDPPAVPEEIEGKGAIQETGPE